MIKTVIDTNVLISAVLSPNGNPAKIINMIFDDKLQLIYSLEILAEYKDVLSRPKLNVSAKMQIDIINVIIEVGILIIPAKSDIPLPDESDRIFYDTARSSRAILITGNTKHYPVEAFVITPAEFVNKMEVV